MLGHLEMLRDSRQGNINCLPSTPKTQSSKLGISRRTRVLTEGNKVAFALIT
ncbi:hypothetical protein Syun_031784 [Stephania yunnanensis]|uniref:Uncharacterized protein n=1 Tax=Stephania yunnanensis TaxID=152371 RepID=A0AAP0E340_9MAGN